MLIFKFHTEIPKLTEINCKSDTNSAMIDTELCGDVTNSSVHIKSNKDRFSALDSHVDSWAYLSSKFPGGLNL